MRNGLVHGVVLAMTKDPMQERKLTKNRSFINRWP
jgi:hypothetical protein